MRGPGGRGGQASGRGRSRGRWRGRGRGRGAKRPKAPKSKETLEDFIAPDLTPEEAAYQAASEQGFLRPYEPTVSAESLARNGPPVVSSPRGVVESLVYKIQVASGQVLPGPQYDLGDNHLERVQHGRGTLFETEEERAVVQAYNQKKGKERARAMGVPYEPELNELGSLSEKDQARVLKEWVGGQYVFPRPANTGDVLGQVAGYTRRNETYLPDDARKFEEKLKSLLPASAPKPRTTPPRRPL